MIVETWHSSFCRLALRARTTWIVWENVPGCLSSNEGRDFGSILGGLAECGYGFAYRVLDAQFVRVQSHPYAVPQRRRRLFLVGYLGDWRPAAQVLFERESMCRNPAPIRKKREGVAGTITSGIGKRCGRREPELLTAARMEAFGKYVDAVPSSTLKERDYKDATDLVAFSCKDSGSDTGEISPTLRSMSNDKSNENAGGQVAIAFNARQDPVPGEMVKALDSDGYSNAIAFDTTQITSETNRSNPKPNDACHTLASRAHVPAIASSEVRRLTPRECERLQGFPDDYTLVPYRGKLATDAPRYKAIGNSMAVNVMSWIGQRIQMMEDRKNDS